MTVAHDKLTDQELRRYWDRLSCAHLAGSADGFEVICFAGMPDWFNRFMHRYQVKAFRRLLASQSFSECDVLDIGTGVGRWARVFAASGAASVVGVDIEPARLARARSLGGAPRYELMSADALAFADASFDVVNSITVLQHMPHNTKRAAIAEIARVLRPGGRVVLFEITDLSDDAPHVFPWRAEEWQSAFAAHGIRPRRTVGDQYVPLLRLLKSAHGATRVTSARAEVDALKAGRTQLTDRATMSALRAAIVASYPLEEVFRYLPPRCARITGFLMTKEQRHASRRVR